MGNEFLEAALVYQARGWSVIPLQVKDKRPALTTWLEYQTTPASEAQIREWWQLMPDANVGLVTGQVSGIIVLDVDGDDGRQSLGKFELPTTLTSSTGKGNHYLFGYPGHETRNFARKLPGLDLRGDGGYIVAPPSIHPSGRRYEWATSLETPLADLPEWLSDLITQGKKQSTSKHEAKVDPTSVLAGVPEGQRDDTLFRYACRLRTQGMTRAEAEVLVLQAARNCSPVFPDDQAIKKLESAWRYPGGSEALQLVADVAEKPETAFEPEVIGALATLRKSEPAEYGKIKAQLKGKVNLNDLEAAVKKEQLTQNRMHIVEPGEQPQTMELILPDIPFKKMRRPYQWTITADNGIYQDTKQGPICACPVPVILTKRLHNIDLAEEKVEIAFYRDNSWHYVTAPRATVFNRTSLIMLANKGLPVTSESSKHLVRYLADVEAMNKDTLPLVRSTSHMGWVGTRQFIPGLQGEIELDVEDGGASGVAAGYHERGTLAEWVEMTKPLREMPVARLMMAASFAAPMLKILGQRVFILHSWGPSRGGKTAALKAALSVWGEPETIMANFNATKVGLERLASLYSDLPLGIDERQVVGDRQGFVESLVYLIGLGKGKARGAKGGGLQQFAQWRTIALTTGEEPLSSQSSTGGIATRAIEIYGQPIPNEGLAGQIHRGAAEHYGTAGPLFVRRLLDMMDSDGDALKTDFDALVERIKATDSDKASSHISGLALMVLADFYASRWIYSLDETEALTQALGLATVTLAQLEAAAGMDDATRAMEYLQSWFYANKGRFGSSIFDERYGKVETINNLVLILPHVFDQVMEQGGYNPNRILRDWAERDWIETETLGGKRRHKVRRMDEGARQYFVSVKIGSLFQE